MGFERGNRVVSKKYVFPITALYMGKKAWFEEVVMEEQPIVQVFLKTNKEKWGESEGLLLLEVAVEVIHLNRLCSTVHRPTHAMVVCCCEGVSYDTESRDTTVVASYVLHK